MYIFWSNAKSAYFNKRSLPVMPRKIKKKPHRAEFSIWLERKIKFSFLPINMGANSY